MILISDKHNCCGCSACVQICPQKCISFEEDEKGFRYPLVNQEFCIDCGLCEKVCPCINQDIPKEPLAVYAAINPNNEIRLRSSSGGIFTMLAEAIIDEGGVVFGARFNDEWEVIHDYTETKEGLEVFRGSKYVQSQIGDTYKLVHKFLIEGRKVLFSGTSCQIAGLLHYIQKDYKNLITVDVACHGVPSPLIWRDYLNRVVDNPKDIVKKSSIFRTIADKSDITKISFRDKTKGWKNFSFVIRDKSLISQKNSNTQKGSCDSICISETFLQNLYIQLFLKNLSLRPVCSKCPAKKGKCGSDITIADYWSLDKKYKELDDDKGTSLIVVFSKIGYDLVNSLNIRKIETTYLEAIKGNPILTECVKEPELTSVFWETYKKEGFYGIKKIIRKLSPHPIRAMLTTVRIWINKKAGI